jgi:hypothetical protein
MTNPNETPAPEQPVELTPEVALRNLYLASREYPCNAADRDLLEMSNKLLVELVTAHAQKQARDEEEAFRAP